MFQSETQSEMHHLRSYQFESGLSLKNVQYSTSLSNATEQRNVKMHHFQGKKKEKVFSGTAIQKSLKIPQAHINTHTCVFLSLLTFIDILYFPAH